MEARAAGEPAMTARSGRVSLRDFTLEDLVVVESWFSDLDTRRWLGDEAWPRRLLEYTDRWPSRTALAATHAGRVVGVMDVDRFSDGRTAIALAVNPPERRQGFAAAMILTLVRDSETYGISELFGGVENDNLAGLTLVRSAGLQQVTDAPDAAGVTYFACRTDGRQLRHPWSRPLG